MAKDRRLGPLVVIPYEENRNHEGQIVYFDAYNPGLADAAIQTFYLETGSSEVHLKADLSFGGDTVTRLYVLDSGSVTFDPADRIDVHTLKYDLDAVGITRFVPYATGVEVGAVWHLLTGPKFYAGGTGNRAAGTDASVPERLLRPNAVYKLEVENISGFTIPFSASLSAVEEPRNVLIDHLFLPSTITAEQWAFYTETLNQDMGKYYEFTGPDYTLKGTLTEAEKSDLYDLIIGIYINIEERDRNQTKYIRI